MAAKLLHSLADDNPDLQKQIGCMTGIFQLFDRHHVLAARHKRLPPAPGNLQFSDGSLETESDNIHHQQTAMDMNLNKGVNEKQRTSTESSRPSFSSCSSSLSSLDCKAEAEATFDEIGIPPHLARHSLDLREVVKDSMYREPRGMSVKTTAKEEAVFHTMKHKDSPRPFHLSKAVDGIDGKQSVPVDLNESIWVLAKLREAPWYYGETREHLRPSHEVKDGQWHSISKDSPWFSYDARETSRFSFESRDTIKSTPKMREFPRHSLDSREGTWRGHNAESKPSHHSSKAFSSTSTPNNKVSSPQQSSTIQSRPPSVVAKLMGLEALPDSVSANYTQSSPGETYTAQDNGQFPISSRNGFTRLLRVSNSPKISLKDPTSPRRKNSDLVMKPISSSRVPIEPAPWKQQDGNRSSQKTSPVATKAPSRTPDTFTSVYSDIEKRLKDLEFKQSGRDLRALKQILEAMQEKGLLDNRKEEQAPNVARNQRDYEPKVINLIENSTSARQLNPQGNNLPSSTIKGYDSARAFESPIVIMKPAKLVEKARISASSATPIGSQKLQSCGTYVDNKNALSSTGEVKDQLPKEAASSSIDKKARNGKATKPAQTQTRSQQFPRENSPSSVRHSGSVSPRMQQKKLELDKRARPPAPPMDSNKPRMPSGKKTAESGPLGGKTRPKARNSRPADDQMSEASTESRSLSCQGDDSITVDSKTDIEVTSSLRCPEIEDCQSPSLKPTEQTIAELATGKNIPEDRKAVDAQESKDQWNRNTVVGLTFNSSGEMNRKKLESIDHLVQKLRRLNSSHDEARIDYIASLCENTNPDHRYISEILLASGLLLRDLSSELLAFQLHTSGHPINPELFLVLEQTKASSLLAKEETSPGKVPYSKLNAEKFHRKLIFDAVNEILGAKLGSSTELWFQPSKIKLTKKTINAQKLLKELCFEIEKMQTKKPDCSLEEEEDSLKSMLMEDVLHGSESWTEFHCDLPGVVLDVERLIFKDLVDEVVIGESTGLRVKSSARPRRVFRK